jgi:LacI family transcriptional regulator
MPVTMKDIAKRVGITRQTVSEILNNKFSRVSDATRQRVLQIAKELNYQPNQLARSLKTGKTNIIGFTYSGLTRLRFFKHPYLGDLHTGAGEYLSSRKQKLIFHLYDPDHNVDQIGELVNSRVVDGFIFVLFSINLDHFFNYQRKHLKSTGIPFVVIHSTNRDLGCPSVGLDCQAGGFTATPHLIEHGYKNIGILLPPGQEGRIAQYGHYQDFINGYKDALSKNNRLVDNNLIFRSPAFGPGGGERFVQEWLENNRKMPRAFFVTEDQIAYGMIKAFRKKGVKVPEDVALIGFGDNLEQDFAGGDLTSIRQPGVEKGKAASEILMELIENPDQKPASETVILEPTMTIRESCGCKQGAGIENN